MASFALASFACPAAGAGLAALLLASTVDPATAATAVATTTTPGGSIFDLTDTCQGADYVSRLESRPGRKGKAVKSFQQGISLAAKGDWQRAATSFHLTRHLTSDSVATCYHGGALLHARGPEDALRVLLPAIQGAVNSSPQKSSPADATASEELSADTHIGTRALAADILSSIARFDEARRVYNSILRDEPESRQALLGTANLLVKQQKYLTGREGGGRGNQQQQPLTEAVQLLQAVIDKNPFDVLAHRRLGRMHADAEQFDEATRHLEIVVRKKPDSASDHLLLSSILSSHADVLDRFQGTSDTTVSLRTRARAVGHLQQASWLAPKRCDVQFQLGQQLLKQNRVTDAITALRQAVRGCPVGLGVDADTADLPESNEVRPAGDFSSAARCEVLAELSSTLSLGGMEAEAAAMAGTFSASCSMEKLPRHLTQALSAIDRTVVTNPSPTSERDSLRDKTRSSLVDHPHENSAETLLLKKKVNKSKASKKFEASPLRSSVLGFGASLESGDSAVSARLPINNGYATVEGGLTSSPRDMSEGISSRRTERPANPVTCPEASMIDGTAADAEITHYFKRALSLIVQVTNQTRQEDGTSAEGLFCGTGDDANRAEIFKCLSAVVQFEHPLHGSYAHFLLSQCHRQRQQMASFERHLLASAKTAQPAERHFASALFTSARLLLSRKAGDAQTDLAMSYLERVSEFAPSAEVSEFLGRTLAEYGDWAGSAEHLERAIELNASKNDKNVTKTTGVLHRLLAKSLHFSGAPEAAASILDRIVQDNINSTNSTAYAGLLVDAGLAHHDAGTPAHYQRAAELYQSAIARDKDFSSAYTNLARLLVDDRQPSLAVDFVYDLLGLRVEQLLLTTQMPANTTSSAVTDTSPQFLQLGGNALWQAARYDEALLFYRRLLAVSSGPSHTSIVARERVVTAFHKTGQYASAMAAIAACPDIACREMRRDLEEASADAVDARTQLTQAKQLLHSNSTWTAANAAAALDLARLANELAPEAMRAEISIALAQMLITEASRDVSIDARTRLQHRKEAADLLRVASSNSLHAKLLLATMLFESNPDSSEAVEICQSIVNDVMPIRKHLKKPLAQISSIAWSARRESKSSRVGGGHASADTASEALTRNDFFIGMNALLSSREKLLEVAYTLLLKGYYAVGDFRKAVALAQGADVGGIALSTDGLLTAAESSVDLGELGTATFYLKAAVDRNFSESHRERATLLASQAGHMMVRHGYIQEAKELAELIDTIAPVSNKYSTLQLELRAHILAKSGGADDALRAEQLLRASAMIPSVDSLKLNGIESTAKEAAKGPLGLTVAGYVVMGKLLKESVQSYVEAAWCFRMAMLLGSETMDPIKHADIIFELGSSLLESQKYSDAVNFLLLARSKRPNHAPTHNNLGVAYIRLGRRMEAKRMMKAALRIQDGCLARFNLGVLLQEQTSSHGMAITQFRAALRMHMAESAAKANATGAGRHSVDVVEIKSRLARSLEADGHLPEALSLLGEAVEDLELSSSSLQTQALVEQLAANTEEHSKAMSTWRACMSTLANVLSQRSSVFSKLGRHRESVDMMLRARTIWTDDADAPVHLQSLIDLGNAYLHAGNSQAARTCYEQVLDSDPEHVVGLNNMGVVTHRQKDYSAADAFFRKILVLQPHNKKAKEYLKVVKSEREAKGKKRLAWTWGQMFSLAPAEPQN
jgi:tetratricopeptide (TPR) repeat protein